MVKSRGTRGKHDKSHHKKTVLTASKIYTEASNMLKQHETEKVPLKTLIQSSSLNLLKRKRLLDLVSLTAKNTDTIKEALNNAKIFSKERRLDRYLAQILTADLVSRGRLEDQSTAVQAFLKYENEIKKQLANGFTLSNEEEMEDAMPIFLRVNTLLKNIEEVHSELTDDGYSLQDPKPDSYDTFLSVLGNLSAKTYMEDYHIGGLLVFAPNSDIKETSLYKKKMLMLQDKASCLPVFLSTVTTTSNVIDACAGTGHQATQIAAAMHNTGELLALERDKAQFERARALLKSAGAGNVTCKNDDFTLLLSDNYADAEHIFISAPSSTTSEDELLKKNIQRIASFQARLLKCALGFASIKEVIYSTASGTKEENELVVRLALSKYDYLYELEDLGKKLDGWKHFGREDFAFGSKCVRTDAGVDRCSNIFIAKFVRKEYPDPEPVISKKLSMKRKRDSQVDDADENMEVVEVEDDNEEVQETSSNLEVLHSQKRSSLVSSSKKRRRH